MPENLGNTVITIEALNNLMNKTLGPKWRPIAVAIKESKYFTHYELENVLKLSTKLTRILQMPELDNDKDLQSCIALMGLNLWLDIWLYAAYQANHIADENVYQQKMASMYHQIEQFAQTLENNEGVQLAMPSIHAWYHAEPPYVEFVDTYIENYRYTTKPTQVDGSTMYDWMNPGEFAELSDTRYFEQIEHIWVKIDNGIHNYADQLSPQEQRKQKKIQTMVQRIRSLINGINAEHTIKVKYNNITAIDLNTLQ